VISDNRERYPPFEFTEKQAEAYNFDVRGLFLARRRSTSMKRLWLSGVILFCCVTIATAGGPSRTSLKGVKLGDKRAVLMKRYPSLQCAKGGDYPAWMEVCMYNRALFPELPQISELDTIANEPAESWSFFLSDGRVGRITATFNRASQTAVTSTLSELYQQAPMKHARNPQGPGESLMWMPSSGAFTFLSERAYGTSGAALVLEATWFRDRLVANQRGEARRRANDL
jgi:hypothetical protein